MAKIKKSDYISNIKKFTFINYKNKTMKKIVTSAYLFIMTTLVSLWVLGEASAQNTTTNSTNNAFAWQLQNPGINVPTNTSGEGGGLIRAIKTVINWALGMLALVALIVLLRGGRQMVTAAGDEGQYKKGFTILKQAAFGLIFIGVSWLLVSGIFYFIGVITQ